MHFGLIPVRTDNMIESVSLSINCAFKLEIELFIISKFENRTGFKFND
jgi:hypothetical protein